MWQAASTFVFVICVKDGRLVEHRSIAAVQRGEKPQPLIGPSKYGGIPLNPRKGDPIGSSDLGIAEISPLV